MSRTDGHHEKLGRGEENVSLLLTPWFQMLSLQKLETIKFCCFKPLYFGYQNLCSFPRTVVAVYHKLGGLIFPMCLKEQRKPGEFCKSPSVIPLTWIPIPVLHPAPPCPPPAPPAAEHLTMLLWTQLLTSHVTTTPGRDAQAPDFLSPSIGPLPRSSNHLTGKITSQWDDFSMKFLPREGNSLVKLCWLNKTSSEFS